MKHLLQEFKDFIARGNVVDLAVGVVIGTSFGGIVNSLVNDIIMPPISIITGGVNFKDIKVILKPESVDAMGNVLQAITLNIGSFFQVTFNFLIIAFSIFMAIKVANRLTKERKKEEAKEAEAIVEDSVEVKLLREIRDLLKTKND